jgi:3-phenylpropionate/trans-cinnamate dioxygenase ferredoxin reductase subunit
VVDASARTEDPRIFAVGDIASQPRELLGGRSLRLESIPNAIEQARQVVAAILGEKPPDPEVPWFWSDQFDLKVQIAGIIVDVDQMIVRDELPTRLSVVHLRGDRLVAIEAINAARDFVAGRNLIRSGDPVNAAAIRNPLVSIRDCVHSAVVPAEPAHDAPEDVTPRSRICPVRTM